ncbi:MAG: hypothetical protein AAF242_01010 [Bacteroidota bacterium]
MKPFLIGVFCFLILCGTLGAQDSDQNVILEYDLEIEGEYRFFLEEGQFEQQLQHFPSFALKPAFSLSWKNGYENLNFLGFVRLDRDEQRTHWDIRELYYQKARNNWELNVGLKKIFWGVTESNHLVDIINQTDQVESFDGEAKLGQPLLSFDWTSDQLGTFSFFYLPYHRKRVFPGPKGRLRFSEIINGDQLGYEANAAEWLPSFALRWSHYWGIADIGFSQFYGNGREPLLNFNTEGSIEAFYPTISQSGLDLQLTHNAFLWKLEAIYRYADVQDFFAFTGGLEYTFSNVNKKGLDLGLLSEYLYDSRDELSLTATQNDLFIGMRLAFNDINDQAFLIGTTLDLSYGTNSIFVEASRRVGDSFTLSLEAVLYPYISEKELILGAFRNDSFLKLAISKFL